MTLVNHQVQEEAEATFFEYTALKVTIFQKRPPALIMPCGVLPISTYGRFHTIDLRKLGKLHIGNFKIGEPFDFDLTLILDVRLPTAATRLAVEFPRNDRRQNSEKGSHALEYADIICNRLEQLVTRTLHRTTFGTCTLWYVLDLMDAPSNVDFICWVIRANDMHLCGSTHEDMPSKHIAVATGSFKEYIKCPQLPGKKFGGRSITYGRS